MDITKRSIRRFISMMLVLCLMAGMLTPFAAAGDNDVPEKWKRMELVTQNGQDELVRSYYHNNKTQLFSVFNPLSHETTLHFTLQYGQPVKISVYEMANCSSVAELAEGEGMAVIPGDHIGYLVGSIGGSQYVFDETATPGGAYAFDGYNGDLPDEYPDL